MRKLILLFTLIMLSSQAAAEQTADKALWQVNCSNSKQSCWIKKLFKYKSPRGPQIGGMRFEYNASTGQPSVMSVLVNKRMTNYQLVRLRFVDAVKQNDKWKLVPTPAKQQIKLVINDCNARNCFARTKIKVKDDRGQQVNLLDKMQRHGFLMVSYEFRHQHYSYLFPVADIKPVLTKLNG